MENDIPVPKLLYSNIDDQIGSIDEIFACNEFVLKVENTCSTKGIYPFVRVGDNKYKCLFKKPRQGKPATAYMSKESIVSELIVGKEVLVEESLLTFNSEQEPVIPHDYKVYVINNQYEFALGINRNVGDEAEICTYNLDDGSNITDKFWVKPPLHHAQPLARTKIELIKRFLSKHVFKLNHKGLMSWDLYIHDGKCYLGEFTLHPGLLHYSNVKPEYCMRIVSKLRDSEQIHL